MDARSLSRKLLPILKKTGEIHAIVETPKGSRNKFDFDPKRDSDEAGEQTWATGFGGGGAKGEDRGEHGRATHAPDSELGKRVPEV